MIGKPSKSKKVNQIKEKKQKLNLHIKLKDRQAIARRHPQMAILLHSRLAKSVKVARGEHSQPVDC